MESVVQRLAKKIAAPLNYSEEQTAVVQYGLFAIVQIVLIGLVITLVGILAGCVLECWIVYAAAGLLRKSTGGAHAKTANACFVVSIVAVSAIGLLSRYSTLLPFAVTFAIVLGVLIFAVSCILIYKFAPVGHPNKPLNKIDKIKRLRRQSLATLIVYILIAAALAVFSFFNERGISLLVSLSLAVLWQSLTLVKSVVRGGCS